jgi:hypothetical protein
MAATGAMASPSALFSSLADLRKKEPRAGLNMTMGIGAAFPSNDSSLENTVIWDAKEPHPKIMCR